MKHDVLLLAIPLMEVKKPAPAIYHLKGQLVTGGISVKSIDTNIIAYNTLKDEWDDIVYMLQWHTASPDMELYATYIDTMEKIITEHINETDPDWIGLSIFSLNSRRTGTSLLKYIRATWPDKKVVIGGSGLGDALGDMKYEFAQELLRDGLIDYYLPGEAEVSLVNLIVNDNPDAAGINKPPKQIANLEGLAFANYDDCDHSLYPFSDFDSGKPTYVLTGSRGCVRRCDFCDIYRLWPKFKTRGGIHVASEMIHHFETRGVDTFYFSDSLINGSMSAFRDLVDTLLHYQEEAGMEFRWGGQFICRTSRQMSLDDYKRAAKSGLENVGIGLEHASDRIRKFMRKGFDNHALHDTIHNLSDSGIHTMLNFMAGHPQETLEDHLENIKFLHEYQWASHSGTIASINLQHYIAFLPGTDFADKKDELVETEFGPFWCAKNVDLDFPEIYRRRKEMSDVSAELKWNAYNEGAFMTYMDRELVYYKQTKKEHDDKNKDQINESIESGK